MLKQFNVGDIVNFSDFIFESYDIKKGDNIYNRIYGRSYIENNYISLNNLIYIKLLHYDYNSNVKVGELIINKVIINEIKEVFKRLFDIKYQIYSMKLIDDFWIENDLVKTDRNSIINNNTSAFCYRNIMNKNELSNHALGIAIDINPYDNPCVPRNIDGSFDYSLLTEYEKNTLINREEKAKTNQHLITLEDIICDIFRSVGFECGGIWPKLSNLKACDWQHFAPNVNKMKEIYNKLNII